MEKGTKLLEGSIWKGVVAFAIPLFLGNLFQQLYNTVDSLIVGNFLGSDALAAVSSSGSLIFLLVGFFNGIAVGAGVVFSKYFGAYGCGIRTCLRTFAHRDRHVFGTADSGAHGDAGVGTAEFNPVFPHLFCGIACICHV